MNKNDGNLYGHFGWREFSKTRQEMLNEFDRSKGLNQSRPIKTEQGPCDQIETVLGQVFERIELKRKD